MQCSNGKWSDLEHSFKQKTIFPQKKNKNKKKNKKNKNKVK